MKAPRRNSALVQLLNDVSGVTGGTKNDERTKGSHSGGPSRFDLCEDDSPNSTYSRDAHKRTSTSSQHDYNKFHSSSDSNMSTGVRAQPAGTGGLESPMFNLPQFEEGLANVDSETLRSLVKPIWESLSTLDAEELLCLERVDQGGAPVQEGYVHVLENVMPLSIGTISLTISINYYRICVRPIHEEITPPKLEYRNGSCVRYLHVAEMIGRYSIGIFVFPPHATIPLHDHPEMCVLSRVLYGDLTKRSLDLEPQGSGVVSRNSWLSNMMFGRSLSSRSKVPSNAKRGFHREPEYLQAPAVTMLFPLEGNVHEFVAGPNGAAVLDVLLPPYEDDRECTFYSIQEDQEDPRACWIVPTGQPEDFHCLSGEYRHLGRDDDLLE
jgi:hypothetical protein